MDESGLLIVDKPGGLTSQQVVGRVRRAYATRKAGHAGTLDPMATGVLIVGLNRATRLLGHLGLHDKAYQATMRLGMSTSTDDAEGEPTGQADASGIDLGRIELAVARWRGDIMQVPSAVSAIKVDGKRAYALARAGEDVKLAARPVTVSRFDVLAARVEGRFVDVDVVVECSSGTYVRALARDVGADLGVGAHLTALRRTRIGGYRIDDAVRLEQLPAPLMSMAQAAVRSFSTMRVDAAQARDVGFGRALKLRLTAEPTGLIGPDGALLGLYRPDGDWARPLAVLI